MSGRHGTPLRGLMSTKTSPLFQGFFGRMFRFLHHATFGKTEDENIANLTALGTAMAAGFDPPKDGKDEEESGIPALYTYLGQFIDHDLTFDPASSLQKQNDPNALTDFRSPAFDLDCVYGRGPDDQPYLYVSGDDRQFLLGNPLTGGAPKPADAKLLPIFPDLVGFQAVKPDRGLDWGRFIDIDTRSNLNDKNRLQLAYRIDTSLVDPLGHLPPQVATNPSSLAERNLLRGWRLGLPS